MTPPTLLRYLIAGEIMLACAGMFIEFAIPDLLPPALVQFRERRAKQHDPMLDFIVLLVVLPNIASWFGLWHLRPWGRSLYTAATVGYSLVAPFVGPTVMSAVGGLFSALSAMCSGAILILIWYSPLRTAFAAPSRS